MPRRPRYAPPGICSHVVNRGNDRRRIFFKDADYDLFLELLAHAKRDFRVSIFAVCPMPNHFHLIARPEEEEALSLYMQWVSSYYATDLRARTDTRGHGHVFQRRFWNALLQDDEQFLSVLRYVEANAKRAGLVDRAQDWRWGSLALRAKPGNLLLDELPTTLPDNWTALVNTPQTIAEIDAIRHPTQRGRRPLSERRAQRN